MTKDVPTATDTDAVPEGDSPTGESNLLRPIRQAVIFVLGISVVIVGIAMIVLPGPATVVIPAGLAILATEFVWARRWLNYLKQRAQEVANWTAQAVSPGTDAAPDQQRSNEPLVKQ